MSRLRPDDARALVRRARAALVGIVVARGAVIGAAVALVVAVGLRHVVIGSIAGAVIAAALIWRSRRVRSIERVALWIEERDPALRYELVTSVDARYPAYGAPTYDGPLLRRAAILALWPAVAAMAVAAVASVGLRYVAVGGASGAGGPRGASGRAVSRLTPLVARVVPPAYSHQPTREVREPTSVTSLVGSDVTLIGPGDTTGLRVRIGDRTVPISVAGRGQWQVTLSMPAGAVVVRLSDDSASRSVVLTPIPDAPPVVELVAPARDSTMRVAQGTLTLAARASDDIGLADGYFEIIVTAGEEEAGGVKGRTLAIGRVAFANARAASFDAGLMLAGLQLNPGDVVSIRAVVRDGNTVSGPGIGTSDTRTFRLATKNEYDSLTITPQSVTLIDSSYMTQRMIVIETQALLKRMAHRTPRDTVVTVSRRLAGRQEALKARVAQLLFGSNDGGPPGESVSAVEQVLFDTAYHAMGDAGVSLAIADPKEALPRELVALAALDSVRKLQHRLYLRGQPPTVVVNVPHVRMTGTDKPDIGLRTPAVPADTLARRLAAELAAVRVGRPGIADTLAQMEAAAYGVSPALSSALADAARAVSAGESPLPALARARRIVSRPVRADTTGRPW